MKNKLLILVLLLSGCAQEIPVEVEEPAEEAGIEVVAEALEIPWELVFLPDGDMLVTERPGRLLRIGENKEVIEISEVSHRGEGGLLGLALHPEFEENSWVYLYLTTAEGSGLSNRVERYKLDGSRISEREVVLENIPGAIYHDGGRVAFGPDGYLYITTGDAGVENNAQNTESLAGKILRIEDDGDVPEDNPFGNEVYSYGHRNPQGLTWDEDGNLWVTEHGRSGISSGYDELNLIIAGANYGWPTIQGDSARDGMKTPATHSTASVTWAPSGAIFYKGQIFFAGLRGEAIYSVDIVDDAATNLQAHFQGVYGRLRTIVEGPDGMLYILTNNRDGRGDMREGDDKIIRIDPSLL